MKNTLAVRAYLKSQRRTLVARGEQRERLKNVDLKALLPSKSPLDNALARKSGRGTQRPTKV